jgi:hypothetical protein
MLTSVTHRWTHSSFGWFIVLVSSIFFFFFCSAPQIQPCHQRVAVMTELYSSAARVLAAFVANQGGIKTLAYARGKLSLSVSVLLRYS